MERCIKSDNALSRAPYSARSLFLRRARSSGIILYLWSELNSFRFDYDWAESIKKNSQNFIVRGQHQCRFKRQGVN